jgi:hypothetical protein
MSEFTDDMRADEEDIKMHMRVIKRENQRRSDTCPYCKAKVHIKSATVVYGPGTDYGKVLICSRYPTCDAYVGCHRSSCQPKGTMANSELRALRVQAHKYFDMLWKEKGMSRHAAYDWLTVALKVNKQVHIGESDIARCRQIIEVVREKISPKLAF